MKAELLTLRVVHILSGIFWVGSMIFTTFFLAPALRSSPALAGQLMAGLQKRRLFIVLPTVALLTIASGTRLMWIASAGFSDSYFATAMGRTLVNGATAATIAFLLAMLVSRPGSVRLGRLGASLGTTTDETARQQISAEMQKIGKRVAVANILVVVLLLFAAASMAVARYI